MKTKIFLPLISNGMALCHYDHMASMMAAWTGRQYTWMRLDNPSPDGAMNIATACFLKTECEEMVIIDGDLTFTREQLDMILSHEVPLVGGIYAKKKKGKPQLVLSTLTDENPFAENPFVEGVEPLVEVEWVGKGFMRINRSVFEDLKPSTDKYDCDFGYGECFAFWKNMTGGHSEDRYFCKSYRDIGGKIYVDQRALAMHKGWIEYPTE